MVLCKFHAPIGIGTCNQVFMKYQRSLISYTLNNKNFKYNRGDNFSCCEQ